MDTLNSNTISLGPADKLPAGYSEEYIFMLQNKTIQSSQQWQCGLLFPGGMG